jgi:hypothetical protein
MKLKKEIVSSKLNRKNKKEKQRTSKKKSGLNETIMNSYVKAIGNLIRAGKKPTSAVNRIKHLTDIYSK